MNKAGKLIRSKIAAILIVVMCINSFGAVVGDNDGAAFITKAEFESLQNEFRAQINKYNSSIDNKIDGAIAAYLSGISIAKQKLLDPVISNYSEMMWANDLWIYGRQKKFTDYTTYTVDSSNVWYVPELNEKRILLRQNNSIVRFYDDATTSSDGYLAAAFDFKWKGLKNGLSVGIRNSEATDHDGIPVSFVDLIKDSKKRYVLGDQPIRNFGNLINAQHFKKHVALTGDMYLNREYEMELATPSGATDIVTFNTPTGNQVFNCVFGYKLRGYWDDRTKTQRLCPTFAQFNFPSRWQISDMYGNPNSNFDSVTHAAINDETNDQYDGYYARGVTWNLMDSSTQSTQRNFIQHLMLATDSDLLCNAGYRADDAVPTESWDFSTATESCTMVCTLNFFGISNPTFGVNIMSGRTDNRRYVPDSDIELEINLPLWPTIAFKEINNKNYSYDDNNKLLQFGSGLPLSTRISDDGYLQIEGKYSVSHLLTGTTNDKVEFDFCNQDFNNKSRSFFTGYKGLVDAEKTTETPIKLNCVEVDDSEKKFKFTIPVKEDDEVWMKIRPKSDDGGKYAKITDLSLKLFSNG